MPYVAPFLLTDEDLESLPDGTFIVPICTTRERFRKITNALWAGGFDDAELGSYDHLVDLLEAIPRIRAGCEYDPTENCRVLPLNSAQIAWFPESPYNPDEDVPSGYLNHPWTLVDTSILSSIIAGFGLGYKAGDVFTDILHIPFDEYEPENLYNNYHDLPNIRISGLMGAGIVRLHLLGIPQGGRIGLFKNGVVDLFALQLVETNKDLGSFPPETQTATIVEVQFESAGENFLDVVWLPVLDEGIVPLFYGGGIRAIEVCGFGMPLTDPCCPDENDLLVTIINNQNSNTAWWFMMFDDGTPPSFAPDAPENFDSSTGDTNPAARTNALCDAVRRYVYSILEQTAHNIAVSDDITDVISLFPPFGVIVGLVTQALENMTSSAFAALMADTAAINDVICAMVAGLAGEPVSYDNFRDSLNPGDFSPTSNQFQIAVIIDINNAMPANYRGFASILGSEYQRLTNGGSSDCPCGCADDIVLEGVGTTTVVQLTANTFQITQTVIDGSDPARPNARVAVVRDILGRCFKLVDEGAQGASDSGGTYCNGTTFVATTGGSEGVEVTRLWYRQYSNDIDTIFTVACPEEV